MKSARPLLNEDMFAARTVSTLLCHEHVPMALDCLGSLQRNLDSPVRLRIHDDGTLTDGDAELLRGVLEGVTIVSREEADDRVNEWHSGLRRTLVLRKTFKMALKAVDTVAFCDEEILAYSDSDVLYMKRMETPFRLGVDGARALFMRDRAPSYSLRSWHKAVSPSVRLPAAANAGMIVAKKSAIDLDLFEWFVTQEKHKAIPYLVEQTYWAMLGMRIGCRVFDPRQVRVMREGEDTDDLVVGHFTSRTRYLLPTFVRMSKEADLAAQPATLRTVEAGTCTVGHLLYYEMQRLMRRAWH